MRLQPVEPRRLYRQIADQLRALVASGGAAPGARLPSERELARQLRVSRASLREALIALELEGLLEVRVGSGIYVAQAGEARAAPTESGPFEVMHARQLIEPECAALAARNAGAAQLRALREAHLRYAEEAKRHHNPLEADQAFHLTIADATGNSALLLLVQTLWQLRLGPMYRALERKLEYPAMAADTQREHQAVLAAIVRRDPRAARAAMRRHMTMTRRRYSKDWKAVA